MLQPDKQNTSAEFINFPARNFHGAAIIDTNGKEMPITELMVNQALDALVNYLPHCTHPLSTLLNR